jgi:hypothetical protein
VIQNLPAQDQHSLLGLYSDSIYAGNVSEFLIRGLKPGIYYFAVTACDKGGFESVFSEEKVFKVI